MKILLSPAKLISLDTQNQWKKKSNPKFIEQSQEIISVLQQLTPSDLQETMAISNELAQLNTTRYAEWKPKPSPKKCLQAALAFKGEVYRGLDAESLNDDEINYLHQNLYILSGLYGILKPTDKIMLYRLEMGSKIKINNAKNLYDFWQETLTNYLNSKTKRNEIILNLASNEYAKVLNKKQLKGNMINVDFLDLKNGNYKKIMVFFKQARGAMARFCATNEVNTLDALKAFNLNNYAYDESKSTDDNLVFTR